MRWAVLAFGLVLAACQPVSPVDEALAPLLEKVETEQEALSHLPANASLKTRMAHVYVLDQAPRQFLNETQGADLPEDIKAKVLGRISTLMSELDRQNLALVLEHLPPEGWYLKSQHGIEVATTAFLVVQHSDLATWRRFVPVLEPLVAQGEVGGEAYGLMFDRLALAEGRPQSYGSQMACMDGQWRVQNLEAPDAVNQRRRDMGFTKTLEEYEAMFASQPCS
jgi:hypothetical protein